MMAETEYVLALSDPQATALAVAGGKGASLARLSAAGMPVPEGFIVSTVAYRRFVEENNLEPAILTALEAADASQPTTLEATSRTIRELFSQAQMHQDISAAIVQSYVELGGGDLPIAVRSSATAEDLPGMSFAGQQETYLNVRGEAALLDAVKRCWASLWTARAIAYRLKMGIDHRSVAMAVVVQTMVPSEVSGVLFTANPTSGERDELVINASFGLGESVVSGRVTPDSFVLDKSSLALKDVVLGTKGEMIVPADGQGTITRDVPEDQRVERSLSEGLLRELGKLAIQVEKLYEGVPQDIEWAVSEGRCYLLQARPMTGLPPAPLKGVRWESPIPGMKWVRRNVAEHMPEPLSPLFEELYLKEGMELAMAKAGELTGEADLIGDFTGPWYATVNGYAYLLGSFKMTWGIALKSIAAVFSGKMIRTTFRRAIPYWRDEALPAHLRTIERWRELDLASAPDERLLDGIRELARAEGLYWGATDVAIAVARGSDMVLDRFLSIAMPRSGLRSALFLRGFPSKALEAEAELQAIAEQIRASDDLRELIRSTPAQRLLDALRAIPSGGAIEERLQRYLDRYGHQVYNLDFAEPTQAEDPTPVLLSLKAHVKQASMDVRARQAEIARERESLVEKTARSLDPLRRRIFLKILRWAQGLAPCREEAFFYVGSAWPALRRLALELGRRLAEAGSLHASDDVFYLESKELLEASEARRAGRARPDLARLARERRELRDARKRLHPPAAVPPEARMKWGPLDISFAETQKRNVDEGPTLRGFPVSPGQVTAPASVILSPADFDKMVPDTILVCPTTTPAWTPLLSQARGLVTDIGGVTAHGSIVAREYGIPAVMGTGNGTCRIRNRQMVAVDGEAGNVTLLDEVGGEGGTAIETRASQEGRRAMSAWLALRTALLAGTAIGIAIYWRRRSKSAPNWNRRG